MVDEPLHVASRRRVSGAGAMLAVACVVCVGPLSRATRVSAVVCPRFCAQVGQSARDPVRCQGRQKTGVYTTFLTELTDQQSWTMAARLIGKSGELTLTLLAFTHNTALYWGPIAHAVDG